MIFSIVAVSILLGFCFRLNIFTSKISNLLLPLEAEEGGALNLDITYFTLLLLLALELRRNLDEKKIGNIDVRLHVKLELQETGY